MSYGGGTLLKTYSGYMILVLVCVILAKSLVLNHLNPGQRQGTAWRLTVYLCRQVPQTTFCWLKSSEPAEREHCTLDSVDHRMVVSGQPENRTSIVQPVLSHPPPVIRHRYEWRWFLNFNHFNILYALICISFVTVPFISRGSNTEDASIVTQNQRFTETIFILFPLHTISWKDTVPTSDMYSSCLLDHGCKYYVGAVYDVCLM